ncbi:uncharacterized protein LOC126576592 [Anopheles aquasalis]|uniref:uncharacterized protein LOC126576592 n=1 Tax=Anopheles aquasalis TaxID=42839 RepID=UPI00215ABD42|nr:uncharacterized protein LOC126576592 [Anopheles aquasalis]
MTLIENNIQMIISPSEPPDRRSFFTPIVSVVFGSPPERHRLSASEHSYCSWQVMLHHQRSMLLVAVLFSVLLVFGPIIRPVAAEKEASEGFFAQLWDSIFGSKSNETCKNCTVSTVPTDKNDSSVPELISETSVRLNVSTSTETTTTLLTMDSVATHPKGTLLADDKIVSASAGNGENVSNTTITSTTAMSKESNSTAIDSKLSDSATEKSATSIATSTIATQSPKTGI